MYSAGLMCTVDIIRLSVRGVPLPPLFGLKVRTPTFQDKGEEFAVTAVTVGDLRGLQ